MWLARRRTVAGLFVPADDVLVGGLHEEELILQVHLLQAVQGLEELVKGLPAPDIGHQGHPAVFPGARPGHAQAGKAGDEGHRHVVHAVKAKILQKGSGRAFPRAGQAGNDDKFHRNSPLQKPEKFGKTGMFVDS